MTFNSDRHFRSRKSSGSTRRRSTGSFKFETNFVGWQSVCKEALNTDGILTDCPFTLFAHTAEEAAVAMRQHINETHR